MVLLLKQEVSDGDVRSTLRKKNGRASSPTIFSKKLAPAPFDQYFLKSTV